MDSLFRLMPRPSRVDLAGQQLALAELRPAAGTNAALNRAVARFNAMLGTRAGAALPIAFSVAQRQPAPPELGDDESYCLAIAQDGVTINAPQVCGARRALATLAQLAVGDGTLPVARIEDRPRFPWRGLMLDVARRPLGLATLFRVIDAMAFYKLNVLHLHLSDDQGFRLQSSTFPKLASRASYSPEQLRQLVCGAAERGIRVVPELDMPGHVTSWLAAYPEWGLRPDVAASKRFGPHEAVLNVADPAVYDVIESLFGELAEIFPDPYVHIGGDEVQPAWWMESPQVRSYMAERELTDAVALQAHFNRRVAAIAEAHGKRLIGWDEVLQGGAPVGMVVQTWRGATARDRALAAGCACIESSGYYLDLCYPADVHQAWDPAAPTPDRLAQEDALPEDPRLRHAAAGLRWAQGWREPALPGVADAHPENTGADGRAFARPARRANGDPPAQGPLPAPVAEGLMANVLGGEACLWGELVDERILPVRLWSRMPVIAERLWSFEVPRDGLGGRLETSLDALAAAGLVDVKQTSRALLLEFGVAESQIDAVELLEPIKWYGRLLGDTALAARLAGAEMPPVRPYDLDTPLNRPVDALLPESLAAKRFAAKLEGDTGPLRKECERLLDICNAQAFLPELREPIGRLGAVLRALLDVIDGRVDAKCARRTVLVAGEAAGEYVVALAPLVLDWLSDR